MKTTRENQESAVQRMQATIARLQSEELEAKTRLKDVRSRLKVAERLLKEDMKAEAKSANREALIELGWNPETFELVELTLHRADQVKSLREGSTYRRSGYTRLKRFADRYSMEGAFTTFGEPWSKERQQFALMTAATEVLKGDKKSTELRSRVRQLRAYYWERF